MLLCGGSGGCHTMREDTSPGEEAECQKPSDLIRKTHPAVVMLYVCVESLSNAFGLCYWHFAPNSQNWQKLEVPYACPGYFYKHEVILSNVLLWVSVRSAQSCRCWRAFRWVWFISYSEKSRFPLVRHLARKISTFHMIASSSSWDETPQRTVDTEKVRVGFSFKKSTSRAVAWRAVKLTLARSVPWIWNVPSAAATWTTNRPLVKQSGYGSLD